MKFLSDSLLFLFLSQILAQAAFDPHPDQDRTVSIASTSTEVSQKMLLGSITTRVDLDVGDLILNEGFFEGTYRIHVDTSTVPAPFRFVARGKNEAGTITLPFNHSIADFAANGGILKGRGYCSEKDKSRIITCEVIPGDLAKQTGTIRLTVDTGDRILDFVSQYVVSEG